MSRRRKTFDRAARRRREIEWHAQAVGAAETEDLRHWLIAWVWHNPRARDQVGAVMECARRMGRRKLAPVEASAVITESRQIRRCWSADNLARFLGVTYAQRQALGLTTIGSVNVGKRARKEIRKVANKRIQERKRRTSGVRSRAEYEANSIAEMARTQGVSRMTIYRRKQAEQAKNHPDVTCVSPPVFLSSGDGPVTLLPREASPRRKQEDFRLADGSWPAAPELASFEALPVELRLMALGLPVPNVPEEQRRAA
jgi:hypothetical protein